MPSHSIFLQATTLLTQFLAYWEKSPQYHTGHVRDVTQADVLSSPIINVWHKQHHFDA